MPGLATKSLRVFQRIREVVPNTHYLIVGSGAWRSELEQLAQQLDLAESVHFVGHVSEADLPAYFHTCDLYVHTPRNIHWNFEGFGLVFLEAAVCGKPSVAARSGGVEDAVLDGETGILVPEEDVQAIADAIVRLLCDNITYTRMSEKAVAWARQQTFGHYVDQIQVIYRSVIQV